jgi:hypothetical protein
MTTPYDNPLITKAVAERVDTHSKTLRVFLPPRRKASGQDRATGSPPRTSHRSRRSSRSGSLSVKRRSVQGCRPEGLVALHTDPQPCVHFWVWG